MSPLRALFLIDTVQNKASLQCVGDDALIAIQQKRYQALAAIMNSGVFNPGLESLGLPTLGSSQQVVVIKQEETDSESFSEIINNSAQPADKILKLNKAAIEI